ncbi:hypothetical protein BKA58DRAFT_136801 [Alternaria rosae]|uniref:uncharacterized protein n=1 Tax=Alternaria rosae TaxID=1187941 RepID=UPI001E8ED275|nr:uncharacterized protein BKA58DRAFT_136801 [Alternaria rosae]KAH6876159.1 hypothetical protein BKA58DRAFT_136801 [Alternaria rosae]
MGSKFSRAVRPQVKAAASPVATAHHHDTDHANAQTQCQEATPRVSGPYFYDDINVATSTTALAIPQRRNSAPATIFAASATSVAMERAPNITTSFLLFLEERRLMSIQHDHADPEPPPATTMPPPPPAPAQPTLTLPLPEVQCVICCTELPDTKNPKHVKEVIKPCRQCGSAYCGSCIRRMFTECCKDTTRMPPRCCGQIPIHYAKPHLSNEEFTEFKSKYEEWLTPNPFYCPVSTCSAFIPDRLLPEQATKKQGKRVDSGIGTPTSKAFACPTCSAEICLECRQIAHPDAICNISEFGIDAETTELLKSWGYKRCPKCGHGLKRMYGCLHMECRCGAHFCYICMDEPGDCGGGCIEDDDDDDGEDYGSDDESPSNTNDAPALPDETSQVPEPVEAAAISTPLPASQPRNLDAGGHRYWENQDLDFGEEPGEDYQDRSWNCVHRFETYTIPLAKALVDDSAAEMECVKCWSSIHPEIEVPKTVANDDTKAKTVPASTGRRTARGFGRGNGPGRGCGRPRGAYLPPRGLFQVGDAIGTAPHLTTSVLSPLSQSVPERETSPMEDIHYSSNRVVDTYGNIIATSEIELRRRASDASFVTNVVPPQADLKAQVIFRASSAVFSTATTAKFSLAHECIHCALLVCASCRDGIFAAEERRLMH